MLKPAMMTCIAWETGKESSLVHQMLEDVRSLFEQGQDHSKWQLWLLQLVPASPSRCDILSRLFRKSLYWTSSSYLDSSTTESGVSCMNGVGSLLLLKLSIRGKTKRSAPFDIVPQGVPKVVLERRWGVTLSYGWHIRKR